MTGAALIRPAAAIAWEIRAAWATGRRVAVTLERADVDRIEGHVRSVFATGSAAMIAGWLVPLDRVLAVHLPSRLGDSEGCVGAWHGPARRVEPTPGQGEFAWP